MISMSALIFFVDISTSAHMLDDSVMFVEPTTKNIMPYPNMLGTIEAGASYKRFTFFLRHTSSLEAKDKGLNEIGIRYRLFEWEK